MKIQTYMRAVHFSRSGKELPGRWKKTNSLVDAFLILIYTHMIQGACNIKDTGGVVRVTSYLASDFQIIYSTATTAGLVVGSGTTPVDLLDYKLQTQITTNLTHDYNIRAYNYPAANIAEIEIKRNFTNTSGSTIAIHEAAIYGLVNTVTFGQTQCCFDRTLFEASILAGHTVRFEWRLRITV